ncbi:MAG: hypothetical protein JWN83_2113 [Chitinophagaceae bacterium]|nr:hypothetical protein [Chitinophagaceae bacterium]
MLRKFLISHFLFLFSYSCFAQIDSCHLRISLLTCSPGEELYSTFGHSALRVTDSVGNEDIVYNYGTFNFDEPGFYTKFIRGKLMYYLSTQDFISFKQDYELEKRSMIEQVLNLSCDEKQKMVQLLHENLMNENKFYKYDFLFDNCTTRLRDLLEKSGDTAVHFANVVKEKTSFRQHIFEYMDYNDKLWTKLGMDLLLGNNTDAIMTNREAMFLPDYLLKGFDSGRIGNKPVVSSKITVIDLPVEKPKKNFFTNPVFIFWLLFIAIVLLSLSKSRRAKSLLYGFDGFLFFITGFAGVVILIMWFGTEHIVCRNNYNILWAWPTHAIAAFFINSRKKLPAKYFTLTAIVELVVLLIWFFVPQQMNPAFIPVVLLLILRSLHYAKQPAYNI